MHTLLSPPPIMWGRVRVEGEGSLFSVIPAKAGIQ